MPGLDVLDQMGKEGQRIEPSQVDAVLHRPHQVTFFGNRLCPYAHIAWWSLLEKNVAFDYVHVDLGQQKPEWYKEKVNPYGTVPSLYDGDKAVFESVIIAEYVEEKFGTEKGTRLMPADPVDRAAVRLVIAHFRERTLPPLYKLLKAQTPAEANVAKELILVEMLALEVLYNKHHPLHPAAVASSTPSPGPFLLGGRFSLAEVVIFPFLDRLSVALQHYRGFHPLRSTHLPRLQTAYEVVQERAAWKASTQPPAFYIAVYEAYASPPSPAAVREEEKRRGGWLWRAASLVGAVNAAVPLLGLVSFASLLVGVGVGRYQGWGPHSARTGGR